jgi:hypothetical protein
MAMQKDIEKNVEVGEEEEEEGFVEEAEDYLTSDRARSEVGEVDIDEVYTWKYGQWVWVDEEDGEEEAAEVDDEVEVDETEEDLVDVEAEAEADIKACMDALSNIEACYQT